jgi:predicted metal-binding membrane protein
LCLLAALAWAVTVIQARGMGVGFGTMGLSLAAFLALWVVMMTAMMFPSVAPMVVMWIRSVSARPTRRCTGNGRRGVPLRLPRGVGRVRTVGLCRADRGRSSGERIAAHREVGRCRIFLLAGLYQLTPSKQACLRHCRSPIGSLFHDANFKARRAISGSACITACTASAAVGVS